MWRTTAPGHAPASDYLNLTASNPPTQTEVQAVADKMDELLQLLKRI